MSRKPEIDETLDWLGSVEAPPGMEARIQKRLGERPQITRTGAFFSRTRTIAAVALAASVALCALMLNPALRNLVLHRGNTQTAPLSPPQIAPPVTGGFGTASAVHVPEEPVQVQPTPVNQGRGRSRSGRAVLPNGNLAPLPRGVAAPPTPAATAAGTTP
jgi:hypothetical protein